MSGPAPATDPGRDPALDEGVLAAGPVLEFNGSSAVATHGGLAVLPWRGAWLAARAAGLAAEPEVTVTTFPIAQALVRIQRGRAATQADLAAACAAVRPGGDLVVTGPNALGIGAWIDRVAVALRQAPARERVRAKARAAAFTLPAGARLEPPAPASVPLAQGDARQLRALPGVFSGDGLDRGTALLLDHLAELTPARAVADLGCGAGHLGVGALLAWPGARALLADADARAVASAAENLARCGLADRGEVRWWDATEPLAAGAFDLILINPPAHQGADVSLGPARAMLATAAAALAPGGSVVLVANRRLPYERELAMVGPCRLARERDGFKILAARKA